MDTRGITLIALVVTIIVLLILAGVSLNLIGGSDGIMNRAEKAATATNDAAIKEDIELAISDLQSAYYENYTSNKAKFPNQIDFVKAELAEEKEYKTTSGAKLVFGRGILTYNSDSVVATAKLADNGNVTVGDFDPNPVYKVTYNGNGGSPVPVDNNEYEKGDTVNVKFDEIPEKEACFFDCWQSDGGEQYSQDETTSFKMENKNVELTAQYVDGIELKDANEEIKTENKYIGEFSVEIFECLSSYVGFPAQQTDIGSIYYLNGGVVSNSSQTYTLPTGYYKVISKSFAEGKILVFNFGLMRFDGSEFLGESYLVPNE